MSWVIMTMSWLMLTNVVGLRDDNNSAKVPQKVDRLVLS